MADDIVFGFSGLSGVMMGFVLSLGSLQVSP